MGGLIDLPRGFRVGREELHDWTQHLKITRERDDDGSEVCICWVGTFSLITTDGGGWSPDEGAALGVKPDGTTVTDGNWRERLGDVNEQRVPRWPLSKGMEMARQLADAATGWIPAVDLSFAAGDTLDQVVAATEDFFVTNPVEDERANLLALAFVMLWLSEESRRHDARL